MAEALVLIPEVDIKWAVVDKNTSEALRSWLSCRGLTTTVAESLSTLVGPTHIFLTMINWYLSTCDSEISVP